MSLANLLQENNYDLFVNGLSSDEIEVHTLKIINSADESKIVSLSTNSSTQLNTGGKEILAAGIQFSSSESSLRHYYNDPVNYTINLSNDTETGSLTLNFSRVGQLIFCTVKGSVQFPDPSNGNLVATSAIPSGYRPSSNVVLALPMANTTAGLAANKCIILMGTLLTTGIINLELGVSLNGQNGLTYYIGITSTTDESYCFQYLL